MSLITCENISLSYDNKKVVHDLSFSIEKGECLCVIGENGSGKSTLVKALLGLKKPSNGTITYGEGLTNRLIGYLPQKAEMQKDFPASVKEVVLSGRLGSKGFLSFYNKEDKRVASENMERLGISELAGHSFSELSGGQQQRVLFARSLCATGSLLLLDEPSTALDPSVTAEMYDIIRGIRESGITVVMVSHDMEAAYKCADRILCLNKDKWFLCTLDEYCEKVSQIQTEEHHE